MAVWRVRRNQIYPPKNTMKSTMKGMVTIDHSASGVVKNCNNESKIFIRQTGLSGVISFSDPQAQ